MPSLSGSVLFNTNNTAITTGAGIINVPVTLIDTTTGVGLTVLTNASGAYTFNNVPAGSYTLVESYGAAGGVPTPGDFSLATVIPAPTPQDPPLSAVPSPPAGTTGVQSLSPNTLFVTMAGSNITGRNFIDGPYTDLPLTALDTTLIGSNLVTAMAGGIYGTLPAGSPNGTQVAASAAYPANIPAAGTSGAMVSNIYNHNSGFPGFLTTADHTSRDETGRMFQFDASTFGSVIFTTTVPVSPNTYYLASSWIMSFDNQDVYPGTQPPKVGVRVLTTGGATVFDYILADAVQGNEPIWNETATLFNSANNTILTYQLYSAAPFSGYGNDYYLDDISLTQAFVTTVVNTTKTVDKSYAKVGDTLNYTVVLTNVGESTATNIVFSDTIPSGTSFNAGSLTINGIAKPTLNPSPPGFTITSPVSQLATGQFITITFSTTVTTVPPTNIIDNSAVTSYFILPIAGGATVPQTVITNDAITNIKYAATSATKSRDLAFVSMGDIITYTIPITTTGNTSLINVILTDTIPNGTTLVTDSLTVDGVTQTGADPSPPTGFNIGTIPANTITTISFKVMVTSTPAINPIPNSANIDYSYIIDPSIPTTASGTANTNIVTSEFNLAVLSSSKVVDKTLATLGDILTYTIPITNSGNTLANNIIFLDTIPNGTTLIANSFKQDGVIIPGTPNTGVTLPNSIGASSTSVITFQVTVTSLPTPNPIPNSATATGTFTIDPTTTPNRVGATTTNTNTVNTQINYLDLNGITKAVDKNYANIGEVLTYTITIPNNGSVSAFNVILSDTIPDGTSFVPDSLTLNGVTQSGALIAPPTGFTIGTIPGGTTSTVTFNVTVVSIPASNVALNSATTTFTAFTTTTIASSANTNIVATTIVNANLNTMKTVNAVASAVFNTVTYTISIENTGNETASNILFVDTIPNGTSLIPNSFDINGIVQVGVSPAPPGITIPDIGPNEVTTITFSVTLDTIPTPNPTTNISTTGYNFTLPPSAIINNTTNSNTVSTFVNPETKPLKVVSENYGSVGDTLTYTITYVNNTSLTSTSVTFFDTIPNGTSFIVGSINVNGVTTPGTVAPPTGITIPDIAPNGTTTIIFSVTVDTLPTPNPIPNQSYFQFKEFGTTIVKSVYSNSITTEINQAILSPVSKTVNEIFAGLGDILTYTINLYNSGNTSALNVVLSDTIPNGTTFVTDSITLNGVAQTGSTIAPPSGFTIATIPAGQTATVAFQVTVVSIPTPNPTPNTATTTYDYVLYSVTGILGSGSNNTNTVNTMVYAADVFSPVKAVDKAYTAIPSTLTYTITIQNTGNTTALNLVFSDTIPTGTTFVPNSVTLNGVTQSGAVVAPPGFTVGTLAAGSVATVTFQVTVTTIPTPNPILNSGTTNYNYIKNPVTSATGTGSGNTNTASTTVNYADLSGTSKSVSQAFGTCGDILTYTITIPNNGNVSAFNVFLKDTIPSGTVLIPNSLIVNGVTAVGGDPSVGVTIPSISSGATATLSFMVQVQC